MMTKEEYIHQTTVEGKKGYAKACCRCKTTLYYLHKSEEYPRPVDCPICGEHWWNKPLDEANAFIAQKAYLENRTDETFMDFYNEIYPYAVRIAQGMMKNRVMLPDLEEKAGDGVLLLLGRFLQDPDYAVRDSFGGLLGRVLRAPLFKDADHDKVLSLDWKRTDDDNTLGDYLSSDDEVFSHTPTEQVFFDDALDNGDSSREGLVKDILKIIDVYAENLRLDDPAGAILFHAGAYSFFLKKSRASISIFNEMAGDRISELVNKFSLYLRDYLLQTGKLIADGSEA